MKHILYLLTFMTVFSSLGQVSSPILLETTEGIIYELSNKAKHQLIVDDFGGTFDDRSVFKGKLTNGDKFKIEKSQILRINKNGKVYRTYLDSKGDYRIGTQISEGAMSVIKVFEYRSIPSAQGPSRSYLASIFYELQGKQLLPLIAKKRIKSLMDECPEFAEYVERNTDVKEDEYLDLAFGFYNYFCGDNTSQLGETASQIVIFRGRVGESKSNANIFINRQLYEFEPISIDTIQVQSYRHVNFCIESNETCDSINLNPVGVNYLLITKSKKTNITEIKHVSQSFGELNAYQISEVTKSRK